MIFHNLYKKLFSPSIAQTKFHSFNFYQSFKFSSKKTLPHSNKPAKPASSLFPEIERKPHNSSRNNFNFSFFKNIFSTIRSNLPRLPKSKKISPEFYDKYRYLLAPMGITKNTSRFFVTFLALSPILLFGLFQIKNNLESDLEKQEREYNREFEAWQDQKTKKLLSELDEESKQVIEKLPEQPIANVYSLVKKRESTLQKFENQIKEEIQRKINEEAKNRGIENNKSHQNDRKVVENKENQKN